MTTAGTPRARPSGTPPAPRPACPPHRRPARAPPPPPPRPEAVAATRAVPAPGPRPPRVVRGRRPHRPGRADLAAPPRHAVRRRPPGADHRTVRPAPAKPPGARRPRLTPRRRLGAVRLTAVRAPPATAEPAHRAVRTAARQRRVPGVAAGVPARPVDHPFRGRAAARVRDPLVERHPARRRTDGGHALLLGLRPADGRPGARPGAVGRGRTAAPAAPPVPPAGGRHLCRRPAQHSGVVARRRARRATRRLAAGRPAPPRPGGAPGGRRACWSGRGQPRFVAGVTGLARLGSQAELRSTGGGYGLRQFLAGSGGTPATCSRSGTSSCCRSAGSPACSTVVPAATWHSPPASPPRGSWCSTTAPSSTRTGRTRSWWWAWSGRVRWSTAPSPRPP